MYCDRLDRLDRLLWKAVESASPMLAPHVLTGSSSRKSSFLESKFKIIPTSLVNDGPKLAFDSVSFMGDDSNNHGRTVGFPSKGKTYRSRSNSSWSMTSDLMRLEKHQILAGQKAHILRWKIHV